MGSNVELVWSELEAYSSRVNNCSHANSSLAAIRAKLSVEQLEQFKMSCFDHLLNIDKIQFRRQIVHGVVWRRVAGQRRSVVWDVHCSHGRPYGSSISSLTTWHVQNWSVKRGCIRILVFFEST
ncbi:hypothetical protein L3X38_042067 [Prunus dulcis]|uniref:Uncharacterized protein n=1 Tax=Prunus dulcis TaxID=3755 RepID=A0AAD4YLM2_PRUDU|nr:hypothetical protein L3X38_042067 [Prunus dulcis]